MFPFPYYWNVNYTLSLTYHSSWTRKTALTVPVFEVIFRTHSITGVSPLMTMSTGNDVNAARVPEAASPPIIFTPVDKLIAVADVSIRQQVSLDKVSLGLTQFAPVRVDPCRNCQEISVEVIRSKPLTVTFIELLLVAPDGNVVFLWKLTSGIKVVLLVETLNLRSEVIRFNGFAVPKLA